MLFYAWRLHETKACSVTVVDPKINLKYPIQFSSNVFQSANFSPSNVVNHVNQLEHRGKFDVVLLGCNSLQDFQVSAADLVHVIHPQLIILIESTGYINLEPFLRLNFGQGWDDLVIGSIMNETDVRKLPMGNNFIHKLRNNDNRIYLGSSTEYDFNLNNHENFIKTFKLFQLVAEDSGNRISLLKSVVPKEFMTYQWKLALSRIVFNPLLIIFEIAFPSNLQSQILCKPLVTGILNELLKIIKKMDCKLVKGYENESNLLNYWSNLFPETSRKDSEVEFIDCPSLFYNYFHLFDLEIDLLILQPILLGDDNGVRTPYLENLYSMMCQLIKINDPDQHSIFFQRIGKNDSHRSGNNGHTIELQQQNESIQQEIDERMKQLNLLDKNIGDLEMRLSNLNNSVKEKEIMKNQLNNDLESKTALLGSLNANLDKQQEQFDQQQSSYNKLVKEMENMSMNKTAHNTEDVVGNGSVDRSMNHSMNQSMDQSYISQSTTQHAPHIQATPQTQSPPRKQAANGKSTKSPVRDSVMTTDNLQDLTDIAMYGAVLNGEKLDPDSASSSKQPTPAQQQHQFTGHQENGMPQSRSHQFLGQQLQNVNSKSNSNGQVPQMNGNHDYNGNVRSSTLYDGNGMPYSGHGGANGAVGNGPGSDHNSPAAAQAHMAQGPMNQMNQMNQMQMNHPQGMYNQSPPGVNPQMNMMANGMNMNQMQMNSMNQRYGGASSRSRLNSLQSNNYYDNNMAMNPMQMQMMQNQMMQNQMMPNQMMSGQMMPNQMMPNQMMQNQMMQNPMMGNQMNMPYSQRPRAANRRSGFPMQDNPALIDMGGRGGMPMPGGTKGSRKSTSAVPMLNNVNGLNGGYPQSNHQRVEPEARHNKSMSTGNLIDQKLKSEHGQHLRIPQSAEGSHSNLSRESNGGLQNLNPNTQNSNSKIDTEGINIQVPEQAAKPLGAIKTSGKDDEKKKKKKKGLFR